MYKGYTVVEWSDTGGVSPQEAPPGFIFDIAKVLPKGREV